MDDTEAEGDEVCVVYIQPLTEGARVAQPDVDDGKRVKLPLVHWLKTFHCYQ